MDSVNSKGAIMNSCKLNFKKIIKEAQKEGYVNLKSICSDCAGRLLSVIGEYVSSNFSFSMLSEDGELFNLMIFINDKIETESKKEK